MAVKSAWFQLVPLPGSRGGHARENKARHLRLSSESRYATGEEIIRGPNPAVAPAHLAEAAIRLIPSISE